MVLRLTPDILQRRLCAAVKVNKEQAWSDNGVFS